MPEPRAKKPPMHLDVTGFTPLRPQLDDWERVLIEPVLVRLFESPTRPSNDTQEARDGEAN
jgi:hypothetical protein